MGLSRVLSVEKKTTERDEKTPLLICGGGGVAIAWKAVRIISFLFPLYIYGWSLAGPKMQKANPPPAGETVANRTGGWKMPEIDPGSISATGVLYCTYGLSLPLGWCCAGPEPLHGALANRFCRQNMQDAIFYILFCTEHGPTATSRHTIIPVSSQATVAETYLASRRLWSERLGMGSFFSQCDGINGLH